MEDVSQQIAAFEGALQEVEKHLKPIVERSATDVHAKVSSLFFLIWQLEPMEVAKLELTLAYSINSLFWSEDSCIFHSRTVYLTTQGLSGKDFTVKEELVGMFYHISFHRSVSEFT